VSESRPDRLLAVVVDEARFCSVFAQWVELPEVRLSDRLVDDLELGSLDLLYLLESIEEMVAAQVDEAVLDSISTVGDVQLALAGLLRESAGRRGNR
jgi:acyl carrier protein